MSTYLDLAFFIKTLVKSIFAVLETRIAIDC